MIAWLCSSAQWNVSTGACVGGNTAAGILQTLVEVYRGSRAPGFAELCTTHDTCGMRTWRARDEFGVTKNVHDHTACRF